MVLSAETEQMRFFKFQCPLLEFVDQKCLFCSILPNGGSGRVLRKSKKETVPN